MHTYLIHIFNDNALKVTLDNNMDPIDLHGKINHQSDKTLSECVISDLKINF